MTPQNALVISLKWLVVPVAMAALGYFFVGPQIGKVPTLKNSAEKVENLVRNSATPEFTEPAAAPKAEEDRYADLRFEVGDPGSTTRKPSASLEESEEESPRRSRNDNEESTPAEPEPEETTGTNDDDVTIPDTPPVTTDDDQTPVDQSNGGQSTGGQNDDGQDPTLDTL